MAVIDILNKFNSWLWGIPFICFVLALGIYFMVAGKFFPFAHFGHIVKNTVLARSSETKDGKISPYRAFCLSLGGAVGMGNISGVATSIAIGGPGALFWMWVWAFVGMMVKTVEISLGVYYRRKGADGKYSGSTMDYIERGIKGEKNMKFGGVLAVIFAIGMLAQFLQGSGTYTVAETLNASFGLNVMLVGVIYTAFVVYLMIRGENTIGKFAEKIVPVMCGLYLLGTIVILLMNVSAIPSMIIGIFKGAFTGTAATGGFVGSVVAVAIRQGVSRSVYSNEAGKGSAALIHGSADTVHPVRQGLWGAMEVFCDTLIVCTCTGLAILVTGVWESGSTGAALGVMAFTEAFGGFGKYFVGIMTIVFAFTTSTAWYIFYQNTLSYLFKFSLKAQKIVRTAFSIIFPLTMLGTCAFIYFTGSNAGLYWTIVSVVTAPPLFLNAIALILLRKKFWTLLKDYKARYMGKGQVDPDFVPFVEDDPKVMAIINKNLNAD